MVVATHSADRPWRGGLGPFVLAVASVGPAGASGCGSPAPELHERVESAHAPERREGAALTEPDKIRALLEAVRTSEHEFVQDGTVRRGPEAAEDLEHRLSRNAAGVPTAHAFIAHVGDGRQRQREPDLVRQQDGTAVRMRDWLRARLAQLEGKAPELALADARVSPAAADAEGAPSILDAFVVIERSGLEFVAPPRRSSNGELKGKPRLYTAAEFSSMLRKKWQFLGQDIHDLDGFIEEIASDSFATMEPYRVVQKDGSEEEFRAWLLRQLEAGEHSVAARGG